MARVAGIEIKNDKKLWVSLLDVYGIGEERAHLLCEETKVDEKYIG